MKTALRLPGLTGNQLKLLALITMTLDHIGLTLFPNVLWLRILGRLALPIYAYMIAEGCRHTRSRSRYLLSMAGLALLCQIVYFVAMDSLYQCILVTFSLSIALIYLTDAALTRPGFFTRLTLILGVLTAYFLSVILPKLLPGFRVDYDFCGILLPVLIFLGKDKTTSLIFAGLGLVCLGIQTGGIQWYALLALPLLALYDGTRGKHKLKYLFYIYYPAHLVLLQAIAMLFN